ncbi:sigma-E processing peptidase SpoIIGA [Frisingicoccus sp.]|uniref:sigma-E processing peptidase SpoIIGA n=1 Tax=Frisingicoccus sp. TaxID=1918627 RepID=UPI0015BD82E2|nr:sigma-E processing peptidase SpoIIGA [Frisingicoccus sp.]MEE0752713.1 sigma-E processing peptidase SpoIIGA [Frisingicoccus sp.]
MFNRIARSCSQSNPIKSVHHQILLYGCFFLIGSLCPIVFYHTHFAKEYLTESYTGNLQIHLNGYKVCINALLDTGNCLYEPFSGKPVCLVEYGSLKACLQGRGLDSGFCAIPYHSIGKAHGVLPGITADKLVFRNRQGKHIQSGAIVGIYPGKISRNNKIHAIVHPDILKK